MKKDRKEYQARYYKENTEKWKKNYNSQTQYLRWVDVKKLLTKLKKIIGTASYDLIMDELEKLEREKY